MFKRMRTQTKKTHSKNKGMTLVELIVTIAILAVAAAVLGVSYTGVLEDQRMDADMARLNDIDNALLQVLLYDDAFDEVKKYIDDEGYVYAEDKITIVFPIEMDANKNSTVKVRNATINGTGARLSSKCDKLTKYLIEYVGEEIDLDSTSYKRGSYSVCIQFNYAKVSFIRDPVINNDAMSATNSGDSDIKSYE